MNILVTTPLWSGMKAFFLEGNSQTFGMPAFSKVFFALLNDSRISKIHVLLLIYDKQQPIVVPEEYKDKIEVTPFVIGSRLSLFKQVIKAVLKGRKIAVKENCEFIFGHGVMSCVGSLIGILSGKRHYRRIYGTFLYEKVQLKKSILIHNFFEYLSFKLPCNGLIITNDGTKGDVVHSYLNCKNELHFLINGVDKAEVYEPCELVNKSPYFSYIARIDEWKNQKLLIDALVLLKKEGVNCPHTYFVGPIYDKNYHEKLNSSIKTSGLDNDVSILGPVSKTQVSTVLKDSFLTFSLYEFSNLGNVFLEALKEGVCIVSCNILSSLSVIDENVYFNVCKYSPEVLAEAIKKLMDDENLRNMMIKNSQSFADNNIVSWNDRVDLELSILFNE